MTKQERRSHLEGKIDCLIEYPFTKELREMEAEVFIKNILCEKLHAAHIVVGTDFAFGHEKRGNTEMLKMFSEKGGYTLDVIEKERYDQIVISSTYIRDVLSQGNVTLAAELLGYRYGVTGIVRHGRQLGRTLGFPTMNVEPEEKKILSVCLPYQYRRKMVQRHWKRRGEADSYGRTQASCRSICL